MKRAHCLSITVVFLFALLVSAQTDSEAEKERKHRVEAMIGDVLSDAANLKLGENRAFVLAKAGSVIWKTDPKRARAVFQTAVNELIGAQEAAEANTKSQANQYDVMSQSVRPQILNLIAVRDAEFALESLYRTRAAIIQKAIAAPAPSKPSKISNIGSNYSYLAQNESNLEQSLMRMAADQNPERAPKFLRDALDKGVSGETLTLLKKLNEKDPETAAELASRFIDKLLDKGFMIDKQPDYQKINLAVSLLTEFTREKGQAEKSLKMDQTQAKTLAEKLISFYLDDGAKSGYFAYSSILPVAEKFSPGSVPRIKETQKNSPRGEWGYRYDPELNKLLSANPSAEDLLAAAKKFPVESRRQIYQTAANKFVQAGDMNAATAVLNDNFSDDALEEVLRNLNWHYTSTLTASGKFSEAEKIIDEFPENTRLSGYVSLANSIYAADAEKNKSDALRVLGKGRALLPDRPENSNDLSGLAQLIYAYSNIEPAEAFRTFEALVPQLNELSDAAAIINAFQGNTNVKQGEFLLTQGNNFGFYLDLSSLNPLARKDLDRAMKLVDSFSRREVRTMLKLQIVESEVN